MPDPGLASGVELSWDIFATAGLDLYHFESGGDLVLLHLGANPGALAGGGGPHPEREFLIVQPMMGSWWWTDAPDGNGFLAGFKLGLRWSFHQREPLAALSLVSGFYWLCGIDDNTFAKARSVAIRLEFNNW